MRFLTRKITKSRLVICIVIATIGFFVLLQNGSIRLQYWQQHSGSGDLLTKESSSVSEQSGVMSKDVTFDVPVVVTEKSKEILVTRRPKNLNIDLDGIRKSNKVPEDDLFNHNKKFQNKGRIPFMQLAKKVNPTLSIEKDKLYPLKQLRTIISNLNRQQKVLNINKFPSRPKDGIILIVQVHKRLEYFAELIDSLDRTSMIENVLLVISHDYFSDAINEVVRQIQFCQVLQIFFPFSQQLYPKEFPGADPKDCPRDVSKAEARSRKCNNAENPDKYGHYREAPFVMTKHHWWWKANAVFDQLDATRDHNGPIMFLEEDHYVTPDFYHNFVLLHNFRKSMPECKTQCDLLSLGTYTTVNSYEHQSNGVTVTRWRSYDHNMGMILYRQSWKKIKACSRVFCTYDDYNWDWTLMYMSLNCMATPLRVLSLNYARVYHIGECGMHHKKDCNAQATIRNYKDLIQRNLQYFFPKEVTITNVEEGNAHTGMQNGGWGDPRDHKLCFSFVRTFKR